MQTYIKLYHYSSAANLTYIDPAHYGEGVTRGAECKYAKTGLNKAYFYNEDKPEVMVESASTRYEIYMPADWKDNIYDRSKDPLGLYQQVIAESWEINNRNPYPYELKDGVELKIKELGYKGWRVSDSALPHVVVLFEKLSTQKPVGRYQVLDWAGNKLEVVGMNPSHNGFFATQAMVAMSAARIQCRENSLVLN